MTHSLEKIRHRIVVERERDRETECVCITECLSLHVSLSACLCVSMCVCVGTCVNMCVCMCACVSCVTRHVSMGDLIRRGMEPWSMLSFWTWPLSLWPLQGNNRRLLRRPAGRGQPVAAGGRWPLPDEGRHRKFFGGSQLSFHFQVQLNLCVM